MADPLAIVATVLGTVATAIGIGRALWPASPVHVPRDTALPPAPAPQPSSPTLTPPQGLAQLPALPCAQHAAELVQLQRDVKELRDALPRIDRALIRIEAAREARRQLREEQHDGHRDSE